MKHPENPNRWDSANEPTKVLGENNLRTLVAGSAATPRETEPAIPPERQPDPGVTRIVGIPGISEALKLDPVVGWLVVVQGPGRGNFRAIYRGSNPIGRSSKQRIPIDFGDDSISSEEQAYLVYDERKRQYQLVPNLKRPNLVYLNEAALTGNAELKVRDKVMMGETTLMFVPLCDEHFDWSQLK